MNIRSRNSRNTKGRASEPTPPVEAPRPTRLLTSEELEHEIAKEISRSNRRQFEKEFAILRFPAIGPQTSGTDLRPLLQKIINRLRISDSFGWHQNQLTVLLPETDRDNARTVANSIDETLGPIDSEIAVYPWDDEIVSSAMSLETPDLLPSPLPESLPESLRESLPEPNTFAGDDSLRFDSPLSDSGNGFHPHGFDQASQDDATGGDQEGTVATAVRTQVLPNTDILTKTEPRLAMNIGSSPVRDDGEPLTRITPQRRTPLLKRSVDIIGAGLGLIALSPVLGAAALVIKATTKGPVFFVQRREGKDGKVFGILKFRTMVIEAEHLQAELRDQSEQDGPAFKLKKDPRVTWIGKFLRKSCVDELPQFWNVLKGDMSLVGPRPLPVHESYGCQPWHRLRLTVLPGLTCTWQASGRRNDIKFDDWMRMDLDYIQKQSFWFDAKLLTRTAVLALMQRGSV